MPVRKPGTAKVGRTVQEQDLKRAGKKPACRNQYEIYRGLLIMGSISPPDDAVLLGATFARWNQIYNFKFTDLISMGFVNGGSLLSYGCTTTGVDPGDGIVAFNESILGYPTDLSADTVYLVSSSASDTSEFTIQGLDTTGEFVIETVTATGTTPVAFPGTWNHVQRCISSGADNVGTVYVSTDAGAIPTTVGDQIQTVMPPATNYAINPLLVCPNNQVILVFRFDFNTNTKAAATVFIDANRQGRWMQNFTFYVGDSAEQFEQTFTAPIRLLQGDKLRVRFLAGAVATSATFGMNGIVLRDTGGHGMGQLFS